MVIYLWTELLLIKGPGTKIIGSARYISLVLVLSDSWVLG